jgi:hypothetical protein
MRCADAAAPTRLPATTQGITMTPEMLEQWLASGSALQGLTITAAQRPGVLQNLERIAALAALVNEFDLRGEIEPAPQFTP